MKRGGGWRPQLPLPPAAGAAPEAVGKHGHQQMHFSACLLTSKKPPRTVLYCRAKAIRGSSANQSSGRRRRSGWRHQRPQAAGGRVCRNAMQGIVQIHALVLCGCNVECLPHPRPAASPMLRRAGAASPAGPPAQCPQDPNQAHSPPFPPHPPPSSYLIASKWRASSSWVSGQPAAPGAISCRMHAR